MVRLHHFVQVLSPLKGNGTYLAVVVVVSPLLPVCCFPPDFQLSLFSPTLQPFEYQVFLEKLVGSVGEKDNAICVLMLRDKTFC